MTRAIAQKDLADRVEKASGPDRELDLLITQQFDPEYAAIWPENFASYVKHGQHPAYTASLDAAMSLVPPEWRFAGSETLTGHFYAHLITREAAESEDGHGAKRHAEGRASSLALALTAAALRARQG